MLKRIVGIFSSLKLTVVLLALGIALVFFGTLGQVSEGLYLAQQHYFRSWFTYWHPSDISWLIVPLPGGYLLGTTLVVNLIAAHFTRFKFGWKKTGIWMTHFGIILLLIGQLATDMFATESHMRLTEGQVKNYSDDSLKNELAVITESARGGESVVGFPDSMVAAKGELQHPSLPFRIRVTDYYPNTQIPQPRGPMTGGQPQADHGIAKHFVFSAAAETFSMDDRNFPTAFVEILGPNGSLGTWIASVFAGEDDTRLVFLRRAYQESLGAQLAAKLVNELGEPQEFEVAGKKYRIVFRPNRYYTDQALRLIKFTHERYLGTDTPKDFRSRVQLSNARSGENRELDIYMNNPLRYGGLTYYQSGTDPFDPRVTILQVVKNPGWITPYLGCAIVAAGLVTQFLIHLVGFIARRRTA
jgi:hypothetical protein